MDTDGVSVGCKGEGGVDPKAFFLTLEEKENNGGEDVEDEENAPYKSAHSSSPREKEEGAMKFLAFLGCNSGRHDYNHRRTKSGLGTGLPIPSSSRIVRLFSVFSALRHTPSIESYRYILIGFSEGCHLQ